MIKLKGVQDNRLVMLALGLAVCVCCPGLVGPVIDAMMLFP